MPVSKETLDEILEVCGLGMNRTTNERISDLKEAWQAPLRWQPLPSGKARGGRHGKRTNGRQAGRGTGT